MRFTLKYTSLLLLLLLFGCKETQIIPHQQLPVHLTLGNPSNATTNTTNRDNYLLQKPQYCLSYSANRGTANWVSWHVSATWLGDVDRQDDFRSDDALPAGWSKVSTSDYTNSGFDRGHNTPSADRTLTTGDNSATFLMTNIIPQAPQHNRELWANLEEYTRRLVRHEGQEVYVIMGNYGTGGTGDKGYKKTIANGKIKVPARIWKILVILPEGDNDVTRINTSTRVIAIDSPNNNDASRNWKSYLTTVDAIEKATGYDLLSVLPDAIEIILESKVYDVPVN